MPNIIFIKPDGTAQTVLARTSETVMEAARRSGIDEILAECGGNCVCATCHVFAPEAHLAALPPMSPDENDLLDGTATERQPNSRLSCQLPVTDAMEGYVFLLPATQI
jgi:2Fe-2S ferredoxin